MVIFCTFHSPLDYRKSFSKCGNTNKCVMIWNQDGVFSENALTHHHDSMQSRTFLNLWTSNALYSPVLKKIHNITKNVKHTFLYHWRHFSVLIPLLDTFPSNTRFESCVHNQLQFLQYTIQHKFHQQMKN